MNLISLLTISALTVIATTAYMSVAVDSRHCRTTIVAQASAVRLLPDGTKIIELTVRDVTDEITLAAGLQTAIQSCRELVVRLP